MFRSNLALAAIMGRLVLASTVKAHLDPLIFHKFENQATLSHRSEQAILHEIEQSRIGDFDISCQVPRQMDHRYDRFERLQFVPFVTLDCQLILASRERTDVPRDVIAPADRLHPMNATCDEKFTSMDYYYFFIIGIGTKWRTKRDETHRHSPRRDRPVSEETCKREYFLRKDLRATATNCRGDN